MFLIPVSRGRFAIVDDEDGDLIARRWRPHAPRHGKTIYALRRAKKPDGRETCISLHREIAARIGITGHVDHRNRHGLDCRRENLRSATQAQNLANRGMFRNNKSGFKGVSFFRPRNTWVAKIGINGRQKCLGYHATPELAAVAYDDAARVQYGEFAVLNFPEEVR